MVVMVVMVICVWWGLPDWPPRAGPNRGISSWRWAQFVSEGGRGETAWWEEWESERVSAPNMKTSGRQRNIAVLLWLSLTGKQQTVITILSCLVSVTGWVMRNISYKCKYSPQFSQISVLWYYILRIVQHKPAVINKLPPYNFLLIPKRFSGFRQFSSIVNPYLLHTLRSGFDILSEIDCLSIWLIIGC